MRLAIEHYDEEERRQSLVSAARTELQSKYQHAFTTQQRAVPETSAGTHHNEQCEAAAGNAMQEGESSPASADAQENNLDEKPGQFSFGGATGETMETTTAGAPLNSDETKDSDLVEALERVRLSGSSTAFNMESKDPLNSTGRDNYFFKKQTLKKPPYVAVLEKSEKTPTSRKQRFKLNQ